jgi:hypothetical protein
VRAAWDAGIDCQNEQYAPDLVQALLLSESDVDDLFSYRVG